MATLDKQAVIERVRAIAAKLPALDDKDATGIEQSTRRRLEALIEDIDKGLCDAEHC